MPTLPAWRILIRSLPAVERMSLAGEPEFVVASKMALPEPSWEKDTVVLAPVVLRNRRAQEESIPIVPFTSRVCAGDEIPIPMLLLGL
jgi:hypothetical protein